MTQNGVVTLFRPNEGGEGFLCLGTVPAWIYRRDGIKSDGMGIYSDVRFDVRISTMHIKDIRTGDYVFFGRAESSCANLDECSRVDALVLNGYGLHPHWHLKSEHK